MQIFGCDWKYNLLAHGIAENIGQIRYVNSKSWKFFDHVQICLKTIHVLNGCHMSKHMYSFNHENVSYKIQQMNGMST